LCGRISGAIEAVEGPARHVAEELGALLEVFLKLVSQEWVGHILHALGSQGAQQFGALRRALPRGVSARVLSAKLKTLESLGHVTRSEGHLGRIRTVTYALTDSGRAIDAVLRSTELSLAERMP
jgi:DNA-binding HxlR family transcriptional regulator